MPYKDRERQAEYQREWYLEHRSEVVARLRDRRKLVRRKVAILKLDTGCAVCGYSRLAAALEYHHITPAKKRFGVSNLMKMGSMGPVLDEIEKCVLLCANCHREAHAGMVEMSDFGLVA